MTLRISVPSMPAPPAVLNVMAGQHAHHGNLPTPEIEGFLAGGLPYGANAPLGATNADFQLKADHNELQTRHRAIRQAMAGMGYVIPPLARTMSNLEYVTPAEDELAANSTTLFHQHLNAITTHANQVINLQNGTNAIPPPAATAHTGVPEQDFKTWLGPRYSGIQGEIDAYKAATKNEFYLQATVGFIPSALPELYQSGRSGYFTLFPSTFQSIADATHAMVQSLVDDSEFSGLEYVKDLKQNTVHYQAVVGLLYTIASYMIGQALNKTSLFDGSSSKNAVAFLSKMTDLKLIGSTAMPTELRGTPPPTSAIKVVAKKFNASGYTKPAHWIDTLGVVARPGNGDVIPDSFVTRVLMGFDVGAVGSPRNFGAPDAMPAAVSTASGGQQGAQFEYRYITDRPDTGGLRDALMKIVEQARELNTKHMSTSPRRALLANARQ